MFTVSISMFSAVCNCQDNKLPHVDCTQQTHEAEDSEWDIHKTWYGLVQEWEKEGFIVGGSVVEI